MEKMQMSERQLFRVEYSKQMSAKSLSSEDYSSNLTFSLSILTFNQDFVNDRWNFSARFMFVLRLTLIAVYTHKKSLTNSPTSCMIMGEIFHRPVPQFPNLQNVDVNNTGLVGL